MNNFKNYQYYNFKGGLDFKNSPPLVEQSEKRVFWSDGYNVELLQNGGIVKMNGSQLFAKLPSEEEIIAGFQGENFGYKFLVVVTKNGNFYHYENGEFVLKHSGLAVDAKPAFKVYLNGIFVSNGVDEPFLFVPGNNPEIITANAVTASNHNIRGVAVEVYKGRIWIADGSTLYYSALGKYNDWASSNDSGSISNFHNDTSPITALCCFKDVLVIHKENSSFILSGNSPDNFTIQPFSNLGALSPFGIVTANGKHLFFNKQVYPFVINDLGEIIQGSAISSIIENKFDEFINSQNRQCVFLNYASKSQIWCFLYKSNKNYIDTILIYDYANNAWFQRIVPYKITSAWECDDGIYTGLADGRIVKEDAGSSFLGEPIEFLWSSPFFHFGLVNSYKTIESLALVFATNKDNNFNFQVKKDYSSYEVYDKTFFSNTNSNTLVFYDNDGQLGQGVLNSETEDFGYVTLPAQKVENYLTNITGANKSVQIQIYGQELYNSVSLLGLEFREVYVDA